MSNTVDNRAVQLGFDNKEFERGVKQSVDSLGQLKKGLDLSESAKSLTNLSNAGKSFNLSSIAEGVQNVSNRFSTFGLIGMTVISNLTNAAMELGKKLWTSITAPAKQGFGEYETQMNAIQTIMANTASKGTTLEQVNAALDEMNTYADKTIYSFPEMAKNMGTFTAAGIDLDKSAAAIKGIANLAAVSGSNSQQAATAMYQLSQALSSGTVKLMDWNSVVNAGMGGQVFQDALKETARLHGTAIDDMIKKEGSFRETLSNGWLTSEILTETLSKFTGDLSAEQLKTMGYTEEQIKQILQLGVTANDAATKVKTLSQLKETMQEAIQSGWAKTWQLVVGDFGEAKSFFTYLNDMFGSLIQGSSDARNNLLQGWKNFGGRTLAVEALKNVLDSLMNVMNIFKSAWNEIFPSNANLAGFGLFKITMAIRDFTKNLQMGSDTALRVKAIFKGLFAIFDIGKMAIGALLGSLLGLNTSGIKPFLKNMLVNLSMWAMYPQKLRDSIKANNTFGKAIQKIGVWTAGAKVTIQEFASKVAIGFEKIKDFVIAAKRAIQDFISDVRPTFTKLGGVFESFKKGFLSAFDFKKVNLGGATSLVATIKDRFKPLEALKTFVTTVFGGLISFLLKIGPTLQKVGANVGTLLTNLTSSVGKGVAGIDFNKVFAAINSGLLAALVLAIRSFITKGSGVFESVSGMFKGVTGILDGVRGSLEAYQKNIQAKTLFTIAAAVALLAVSLIALSLVDPKKLAVATGTITVMFADLVGSMALLNKTGGSTGGFQLAATLMGMGLALLLLTKAVIGLSELDEGQLKNSLTSLGALTAGLVLFSKTIGSNAKSFLSSSVSLVIFGLALSVIVGVVKKLGGIDFPTLQQGLIAIGILLAELAAFMLVSKFGNAGIGQGAGIAALAAGILLISVSVEKFGNMDVNVLKQGLITIGAILAGIAAFILLTANGSGMLGTAIGMVLLSVAMLAFVNVIKQFGNLSWDEIGRGLGVLAATLLIVSVAMYAMTGALPGAAALLVVAGALAILTPVLTTLGAMKIPEIATALGVLAAMFLVLGIAGYALTGAVPTLLLLGVAITMIGVAIGLIGAGMIAFSMGLATLAISGVAGALAFVAIVKLLLGLIPVMIKSFVGGIILFATLITQAAPVIGAALLALLLALCDLVIKATPALALALVTLLLGAIQVIRTVVPQAIDAILFLIGELLRSLAEKVPEFVQSAYDILLGFLKGIRDNIGEVVIVVGEIVVEFLDALALELPKITDAGFKLLISFIEGITKAIEDNGGDLTAAIGDLAKAIIKGLTDGLLGGISQIVAAVGNIGSAIISALKTLLGIASPSTVTEDIAGDTVKGFVRGLVRNTSRAVNATENLGNKIVSGMGAAISRINDSLDKNIDMNPTIRPVMDLADIISGGQSIDNIFANKSLQLSQSMDKLSSVAGRMPSKNGSGEQINQPGTPGTSIAFYQTNTSPKALSKFDIYRETRNQLLMLKGLVVTE